MSNSNRSGGKNIIGNNNSFNVLGDNNTVSMTFVGSPVGVEQLLCELSDRVGQSKALPDATKADMVADIHTMEAQLKKARPNAALVRTVWTGIERSVTAAEFAGLIAKIAGFVAALT